jgi:hypothetical protein
MMHFENLMMNDSSSVDLRWTPGIWIFKAHQVIYNPKSVKTHHKKQNKMTTKKQNRKRKREINGANIQT